MMKQIATLLLIAATASMASAQNIFFNEFHYDNIGGDVGEFVEIAGPTGTDLTGWTIRLYNGADGTTYGSIINLTGSGFAQQNNGFGAVAAFQAGIQNGAPDGFALMDSSGAVRQFLSYEGTFTATNGPANGMLSTSIGALVESDSTTALGDSLQLTGSGSSYTSFTWTGPANDSPGATNVGQTFVSPTFTHTLPGPGQTTLIDFNSFTGAGFSPTPGAGQLDSDNFSINGFSDGDLVFGDTRVTAATDYTRGESPGGVATGGIYAFDPTGSNNALGFQATDDDFTPGSIRVRLPNATSETISDLLLSFDVLINNNGSADKSSRLDVSYSTDGATFNPLASFISPGTSDALGFQTQQFSQSLLGLGLAPGQLLVLQFASADVSGGGSRDEFAIDNIRLVNLVPEPSAVAGWCILGAIGVILSVRRRR